MELRLNVAPLVGNEPQHEEIYWSSEDEDEITEDTTSNKDENVLRKHNQLERPIWSNFNLLPSRDAVDDRFQHTLMHWLA